MFQTFLYTMFQHPSMVQCALFHVCLYTRLYYLSKPYFLILLTKQRAYLYRISCGIFLKMWLHFSKYLKLYWTFQKMFLHFRTFHICHWFVFCRSAGRSVLFWSPTRLFDLYCFSIKGRLQDLIDHSSRHSKKFSFFRVLSLWVFYSCIVLMQV